MTKPGGPWHFVPKQENKSLNQVPSAVISQEDFVSESLHHQPDCRHPKSIPTSTQTLPAERALHWVGALERCPPPHLITGLPGGTVVKSPPARAGDTRDVGLSPASEPLDLATHSSVLAGESHGQRSHEGYSLGLQRVGRDSKRTEHKVSQAEQSESHSLLAV